MYPICSLMVPSRSRKTAGLFFIGFAFFFYSREENSRNKIGHHPGMHPMGLSAGGNPGPKDAYSTICLRKKKRSSGERCISPNGTRHFRRPNIYRFTQCPSTDGLYEGQTDLAAEAISTSGATAVTGSLLYTKTDQRLIDFVGGGNGFGVCLIHALCRDKLGKLVCDINV